MLGMFLALEDWVTVLCRAIEDAHPNTTRDNADCPSVNPCIALLSCGPSLRDKGRGERERERERRRDRDRDRWTDRQTDREPSPSLVLHMVKQ